MVKLSSRRFCWSHSTRSKSGGGNDDRVMARRKCSGDEDGNGSNGGGGKIKWELRPGGMLVQKREEENENGDRILVRVSIGSQLHYISIKPTSTFGELKVILSLITNLEPREQRVLFKGKERDDDDYLHMVGVGDMDKVLLLEDPALKERKLLQAKETPCNSPSTIN